MKTVAQLKAEVRKLIWADMEPENLVEQHDEHFQEALAHLAQNVPCEREGNVDIIDFCKTNSKCGMTIVPEPNGVVRRVFTLVKEPNEDWCDPVYFREVDWPLPEFFGKMAMARMRTLPTFPKSLDLGFHPADVSQESPCGRARQGIWAKHRGNIYLAPWIQSVERVCVEWDGVKSRWEDADPVNDSLLYRKAAMLYWHYLHQYFFGDRKDAMGIHDVSVQSGRGTFDRALADLIYACEERRKVRETASDPYWHGQRRCLLTPVIEQEGKPLTPAGPTVLAHIGNFVDGDGSTVAALVDNYAPTAVLAAGVNVVDVLGIEYDQLVGHNYSNYLAPYYGNFGVGAEKNKFWPAAGDLDWSDALEGFHAAFSTPKNANYYDVCLGPVHLFVLDLNSNEPDGVTADSAQGQWLMAKMALSTAPWKVVMASKLPDPIWDFKSWGANLVLTGLPYYERRVLGGLIVVNNGAGGGPQTAPAPSTGSAFLTASQNGAGFIVATRCSLTYSFVNTGGTVVDTFGMHKGPECIDPADSTVVISGAATAATTVCGKQVYQNAGNPNGVVTPATALKNFCIDTTNNIIWVKDDGVISPYGWS